MPPAGHFCLESSRSIAGLHPILMDSFSIFISVISTQSDKWKIFGWRLFFPPSLEGGGPLAVEDFFYTLCLRRPTFVCQQQKWAKMPLGSLAPAMLRDEAEPNPWDRFSAIWQMKNFSALFEPFSQPQPPAPSLDREGENE